MMLCETRVRERAYFIWEDEGRGFGRAEAHWLQAEAELRQAAAQEDARTILTVPAEAAPAPAKKPRASRAKAPQAPAEVLAGVAEAAKVSRKPATKTAAAAPKTAKPSTGRAKSRAASSEGVVLH